MVTGSALPSVPNWTWIPACQQHSEESGAVRILCRSSVSQGAQCELQQGWQVLTGASCLLNGLEGYVEQNQGCPY